MNFDKLKMWRNLKETQDIKEAKGEIKKTLFRDQAFKNFCDLLLNAKNEFERKGIEERFGLWIQMNERNLENLSEEFKKFKIEILIDLNIGAVIKNPGYHIQQGNKYLDVKEYDKAYESYTSAINLDSEFSENAYYNRAFSKLMQYRNLVSDNLNEIQLIIKDFAESEKRINNRKVELNIIQTACSTQKNMLSEHVSRKSLIYEIQQGAIRQAIGMSQEDYDQTIKSNEEQKKALTENYEKLKKENPSEAKSKLAEYENSLKNISEYLEKLKKDDVMTGEIEKALKSGQDLRVNEFEIRKSFPDDVDITQYEDEIEEFSTNGFRGRFEVFEQTPIDW